MADSAPSSKRVRIMRAFSAIFLALIVVLILLGNRSVSAWLNLVVALLMFYAYWWGLRKPDGPT